ncbi:MAG: cyclic nucleotide-binding domain-containing protein [Gracilimonas sp.]|uniref:ATP-binding protein n=1 Tax=Gracilimonas TaxID=649462 RepID=UPI001B21F44F|nr:ATP-binding protein [Gracilimonas sp.]MBO6584955.1 cyclic nucleotide-binding domain-containing protein [Gracilimonas sp.]MBO6615774.1 cyclic nucleotide-binding domain-containing protein [Gracilimonas sp.]
MEFQQGISWLNDTETILRFIQRLVHELDELKEHLLVLEEGEVLFSQGDPLEDVYLLLEGQVKLTRTQADDSDITLTTLNPGSFVGLIAFTTGEPTLTTAKIIQKGMALKMKPQQFEQYLSDHPRLKHPLQQLMLNNMIQRYKSNIRLHTRTHLLNKELGKERDDLKNAYKRLEETHQQLIHQEKMATLGELVAGFAHEVNNPASALMRSAENLIEIYSTFEESDATYQLFKLGLQSEPLDSTELRKQMLQIEKQFPWVHDRASVRKLAQMPGNALQIIKEQRKKQDIENLINHFEAGRMIHNIRIASNRIANLVKSLKSYSRQDRNKEEFTDIRDGIKDTVLVLSNRLKYINLNLDLDDIPKTCIQVGDLNQVWTNILLNACDALNDSGEITISTNHVAANIVVEISDNGPGIPEDIIHRIFEANFTTKNQGAKFGLGLGLPISNEIIKRSGGNIEAENLDQGGARFKITLPVKDDC